MVNGAKDTQRWWGEVKERVLAERVAVRLSRVCEKEGEEARRSSVEEK
jgi:hypothetical protein